MTILTDTYRRARKSWRCYECPRRVQVGESYHLQTVAESGSVSTYRTCEQCQVLRGILAADFDFGFAEEGFLLDECLRDWAETRGLSAMRVYAWWRRQWRDRHGVRLPVERLHTLLPDEVLALAA